MRVVKKPDLKIHSLDATFFKAAALEAKKRIRTRTEKKGVDANGSPFKAYTQSYAAYRAEKGRSTKPNLSFTGKMLSAMGATGKKRAGLVTFSGSYGKIAQENEGNGRVFFALSSSDKTSIMDMVSSWMKRKNGLK